MSTCFIIFAFLLSVAPCALSQQSYYITPITEDCTGFHPENAGYACEAETPSCDTVAYFRGQSGYTALSAISTGLFSTTSAAVATASGLSFSNSAVGIGQGLYIPMTCTCYGSHSAQNVSYNTIHADDTVFRVANHTYEGLTTCQAINDANPTLVVTDLLIGQVVSVPIRCACPSAQQKIRGIVILVTYPVADGDTINSVVNMFGITEQEFLAANNLSNTSAPLFASTTVLLPFPGLPANPPNATLSSSSPPLSQASSSSSSSSEAGIYIGVPVAIVALFLIKTFIIFF